jgi:hypothetical protein
MGGDVVVADEGMYATPFHDMPEQDNCVLSLWLYATLSNASHRIGG